MTEPLLSSDLFLETLGDEATQTLRCAVCLEYYSKPCVLQCGHTFCYSCLLAMAKHIRTKSRTKKEVRFMEINCPNCREPVPLPLIFQRQLTFNFAIASFVDSLKAVTVSLKVDASTNTDCPAVQVDASTNTHCVTVQASTNTDFVEETTHETPDYEYDVGKLDMIQTDLDNMFSTFTVTNNVINDARKDIDQIRREFGRSDTKIQTTGGSADEIGTKFLKTVSAWKKKMTTRDNCDLMKKTWKPCAQSNVTIQTPAGRRTDGGRIRADDNLYRLDPAIMCIGANGV